MRVFNVRLAVILLVIVVVSVVGVHILHGCMVRSNATFFLDESTKAFDRAEEARKEKDPAKEEKLTQSGINFLRWYLQLVPDSPDEQERLGMLLAKRSFVEDSVTDPRAFMDAFQRLEDLLRTNPDRMDARRQLVKMALVPRFRRPQDAKEHLQTYLLKETPNDPELWVLLGQCHIDTGKYEDAKKAFTQAIALSPGELAAYQKKADLLRMQFRQPKEADKLMEQLVKVNPKSAMAHYYRGRYLSINRMAEEAFAEAMQAMDLDPDNSEILLLAAMCHASKKEFDQARECLNKGIKMHPEDIKLYVNLKTVEVQAGKRDAAIAVLQQGIKATGRNLYLLWCLADLYIDFDKIKESQGLLKELQNTGYRRDLIEYSKARIHFVQGRWKEARDGFERVRGLLIVLPEYVKQVDLWLGNCHERLGNRDLALQAYNQALSVDPNFVPAMLAEMNLYMHMGRVKDALEIQKKLHQLGFVNPGNSLMMARMKLLETLQESPSKRDWAPVEEALDAAEKGNPNATDLPLLRAQMLASQDRVAEAESLLVDAREKNPKVSEFWTSLAMLATQEKDWAKVDKRIAEAEKALGDGLSCRTMKIQCILRRYGKEKEAVEQLRKIDQKTDSFSEPERMQLWTNLLVAAVQVNDVEQIRSLSQRIGQKDPNNVQVRFTLFEAMLNEKNIPGMEEALKDIRRVAGENAYWLYGQAAILFLQAQGKAEAKDKLTQALGFLAKAGEARKDWSRVPLMEAAIHYMLGDSDKELQYFLEAVKMGERSPAVIQRTFQLLSQSTQFSEIDRWIRIFEREKLPFYTELNLYGAESAIRQGDFNRALDMAKAAAEAKSTVYREQIWLGRLLSEIGTRAKNENQEVEGEKLMAEAEKAFRRATQLDPKAPEAWLSLVQYLNNTQDTIEAEKVIEEAGKKISPEKAPLALAQCYEILEKTDAATEKYEAAIAAAPQDINLVRAISSFYLRIGKSAAAEIQLRRVLDGKVNAPKTDVLWARRQLALIYVIRGKYNDIQEAKKLIAQNLADSPSSVIDRRLMARLNEADPKQGGRGDAIRDLVILNKEGKATPEDNYKLIQMYLQQGEPGWLPASELLRDLVAKDEKDPRFLIVYIQCLLQRGEISNVDMYLERLEKIAPTWFVTIGLRAEALLARNKPDKAFDLSAKFIDLPDALPVGHNTRVLLVAEKMELLAKRLTAANQAPMAKKYLDYVEKLIRDYLKENPGKELLLAEYLSRRGKIDEALDLLQKSLEDSSTQAFLHALAVILHEENLSKEQLQHLDVIFQAALKQFERPVPLLTLMTDLCSRQNRYADAEACYREILNKNSGNVAVMNNLAVLLALQKIKLDEALQLVNKAIEIAGPLGFMLDSRATVYLAMNDLEKALKDIDEAIAEQETPDRLFHKAQILDALGQKSEAKEAFDGAMKKGLVPKKLLPLELPAIERLKNL